jgi:hypothetical protein
VSTHWYPITPIYPAPLVQVTGIVMHTGGLQGTYDAQVIISRGRAPHSHVWAAWQKGRAVPLAPDATPLYWRPQDPTKWRAPLPEPIVPSEPRMWSSVGAVERQHEAPDDGGQWWRDASRIRYEPAGAISERMAEGRVMRAVAASGHGYGTTLTARTFGTLLADLAAQFDDRSASTSDPIGRFRQTRADISDFDLAMAWFANLDPPDLRPADQRTWALNRMQNVLAWRARNRPWSFGVIADRFGMTPDGARKLYQRSIQAVCRVANGKPAFAHVTTTDAIEQLRERNRAWRSAG